MKRFLAPVSSALALAVAALLGGCLETESLLPAARDVKSDQVIGHFFHEDEKKMRHDYVISASGKKELPYAVIVDGKKEEPLNFQLFDVEGTTLGFFHDQKSNHYTVIKMVISQKQ